MPSAPAAVSPSYSVRTTPTLICCFKLEAFLLPETPGPLREQKGDPTMSRREVARGHPHGGALFASGPLRLASLCKLMSAGSAACRDCTTCWSHSEVASWPGPLRLALTHLLSWFLRWSTFFLLAVAFSDFTASMPRAWKGSGGWSRKVASTGSLGCVLPLGSPHCLASAGTAKRDEGTWS